MPELRIFTGGTYFLPCSIFQNVLPLALEEYNQVFIDSLGFMAEDENKKHLFGLTLQNTHLGHEILTLQD